MIELRISLVELTPLPPAQQPVAAAPVHLWPARGAAARAVAEQFTRGAQGEQQAWLGVRARARVRVKVKVEVRVKVRVRARARARARVRAKA